MENKNQQIFEAISKQIVNLTFINSQAEFFKKHAQTFIDADENKLEYTQIYEAYVYILESIIEIELQKTFSIEEVKAFYEDVKANLKKYEEMDKDTVDSLYAFIEFNHFKQEILKFKADMIAAGVLESDKAVDETTFRIDKDLFDKFHSEDTSDPANKWSQACEYPETDGVAITIWQKPIAEINGKIVTKIVKTVRGEDIEPYKKMLKMFEEMKNKSPQYKEFTVIEKEGEMFEQ